MEKALEVSAAVYVAKGIISSYGTTCDAVFRQNHLTTCLGGVPVKSCKWKLTSTQNNSNDLLSDVEN